MTCNHCPGELMAHDGMQHCEACGCYFARRGVLAGDHTPCRIALRQQIHIDGQPWVEPPTQVTEPPAEPPQRPARRGKSNG